MGMTTLKDEIIKAGFEFDIKKIKWKGDIEEKTPKYDASVMFKVPRDEFHSFRDYPVQTYNMLHHKFDASKGNKYCHYLVLEEEDRKFVAKSEGDGMIFQVIHSRPLSTMPMYGEY